MDRREAMHYVQLMDKNVRCELCGHNCTIPDTAIGLCKVRRNIGGVLYSLNYGKISTLMIDPIEKKPLYHFYPGSKTLSLAMHGCNMKCSFCQNSSISQVDDPAQIKGEILTPEDIIKIAKAKGISTISYTYTEPTVFYEFMIETAILAKTAGFKNVVITNGFINKQPLKELIKFADAFNVDLKSFRQPTYETIMGGKLDLVLETIDTIVASGVWCEITTLLIPQLNDSSEELEDIARFIFNTGKHIPWHISMFHPDHKMKYKGFTSTYDLLRAYNVGKNAGLRYVYIGNIVDRRTASTYCYSCGSEIIGRQ